MRWLLRGILFFAGLGAGVAFAAPCPPQIRLMFPDNAIAPFILGDGEEFADPPGLFFAQSVLSFYTRENEKNVSWDGQVLSAANPVVGVVRGQVGETIGRAHGWPLDTTERISKIIAKLRAGRFDVILQSNLEVIGTAGAERGLRKLTPPLASAEYYAPVSHPFFAAYPEFSNAFWRSLCQEGRAYFKSLPDCRQ